MPGLVQSANLPVSKQPNWSFGFRGGGGDDSDSCSDDETDGRGSISNVIGKHAPTNAASGKRKDAPNPASDDAALLRELDISTREDTVVFKANPWSIARVNAATRPKGVGSNSKDGPGLKIHSAVSDKAGGTSVGNKGNGAERMGQLQVVGKQLNKEKNQLKVPPAKLSSQSKAVVLSRKSQATLSWLSRAANGRGEIVGAHRTSVTVQPMLGTGRTSQYPEAPPQLTSAGDPGSYADTAYVSFVQNFSGRPGSAPLDDPDEEGPLNHSGADSADTRTLGDHPAAQTYACPIDLSANVIDARNYTSFQTDDETHIPSNTHTDFANDPCYSDSSLLSDHSNAPPTRISTRRPPLRNSSPFLPPRPSSRLTNIHQSHSSPIVPQHRKQPFQTPLKQSRLQFPHSRPTGLGQPKPILRTPWSAPSVLDDRLRSIYASKDQAYQCQTPQKHTDSRLAHSLSSPVHIPTFHEPALINSHREPNLEDVHMQPKNHGIPSSFTSLHRNDSSPRYGGAIISDGPEDAPNVFEHAYSREEGPSSRLLYPGLYAPPVDGYAGYADNLEYSIEDGRQANSETLFSFNADENLSKRPLSQYQPPPRPKNKPSKPPPIRSFAYKAPSGPSSTSTRKRLFPSPSPSPSPPRGNNRNHKALVRTLPSERSPPRVTSKRTRRVDDDEDVWRTLPGRKKPRITDRGNEKKGMALTGKFRMPIARLGNSSNAKERERKTVTADDSDVQKKAEPKWRVTTYLPPPKVKASSDTANGEHTSEDASDVKDMSRKPDGVMKASVRSVTEWTVKRVGPDRHAMADEKEYKSTKTCCGNGVQKKRGEPERNERLQYARGDVTVHAVVPSSDSCSSSHDPLVIANAAGPDSDAVTLVEETIVNTKGVDESDGEKTEDAISTSNPGPDFSNDSIDFAEVYNGHDDINDEGELEPASRINLYSLAKNYPPLREAILERKRAARGVWDELGLPSCGVVFADRDSTSEEHRGESWELGIIVWPWAGYDSVDVDIVKTLL